MGFIPNTICLEAQRRNILSAPDINISTDRFTVEELRGDSEGAKQSPGWVSGCHWLKLPRWIKNLLKILGERAEVPYRSLMDFARELNWTEHHRQFDPLRGL